MYKGASANFQYAREIGAQREAAMAASLPEQLTWAERHENLRGSLVAIERQILDSATAPKSERRALALRKTELQQQMTALKLERPPEPPPAPRRDYVRQAMREVLEPHQLRAVMDRAHRLAEEAKQQGLPDAPREQEART